MEPYATLRGVAPLILVRYLYLGGENESIDETMQALGLTNRNYFYRARAELYKRGLLTKDGKLPGLETPAAQDGVAPFQFYPRLNAHNPIVQQPAPTLSEQLFPANGNGPIILEIEPEDALNEGWYYDQSPASAAAAVDRMDDSGDRNQRNSPFQVRRKAQITFLQAQFERLWPDKQLIEANAKTLLNLGEDSAEVVLEAFETASTRDLTGHPFNYIRGILRRRAEESGPQVKTPSLVSEPDYYLTKRDDRIAKKEAKLRALGLLEPSGDDDD